MTIDDKITDEKLQFDINSAAAKISILWSGKIDKYERWRIIVNNFIKPRKKDEKENNYSQIRNEPEKTLTPESPATATTPPVILDPPPRRLTQGKIVKILPPQNLL